MLADGKIYVGTDGGKFFIVRPGATSGPDSERRRAAGEQGQLLRLRRDAGADSRRRGDFARPRSSSSRATRCTRLVHGRRERSRASPSTRRRRRARARRRTCRSRPTELVLAPGQTVTLRARLFDAQGRFLRESPATWSLEGLKRHRRRRAASRWRPIRLTRPASSRPRSSGLTGEARARVVRPLPWTETFDGYADGAAPAGWVEHDRRPARRRDARRPEGAREGAARDAVQAHPLVHRPDVAGPTTRSKPTSAPPNAAGSSATSASRPSATRSCSTATRSG